MMAKKGRYIYIVRDATLPEQSGTYGIINGIRASNEIWFIVLHWGDGKESSSNTYHADENDEYVIVDSKDKLMIEIL